MYPRWGGNTKSLLTFIHESMKLDKRFLMLKYNWYQKEFDNELKNPFSEESKAAMKLFNEFDKAYPNSSGAAIRRAKIQYDWGNTEKALILAKLALEKDPFSESEYAVANYLFQLQRYSEALPHLKKVTNANPNNSDYWSLLGRVHYYGFKDYPRSIHSFTRAINLKANDYDLLYRRGYSYYSSGYVYEAVEDFNASLAIKPGNKTATDGLRLTYEHMDKSNVPRERPKE